MKRKVKKFAGDEGSVVRTRSDKEFEEDSKNPYGRYMPKTKEYTLDEVKDKLSGLFGGKKEDTSKFDELESVKKTKTLKEQIGRKDEDTEAPRRKITDYSTNKGTTTVSEEDAPYKVEKTTLPKKEAAPKKNVGEDAKPLPGVSKDKSKPQNLPGKPEPKAKVTPYSAPKKITKEEEAEGERGKRMEEEAAAQQKKNKEEAKTSAPATKKKEYYRDFSGKLKEKTSDDRRPLKNLGESVAEGAKSLGSSISKFAKENIKSPAQRRDEEKAAKEKKYAKGGSVSSASSRGDGIAQRGKTRGKIY
jgi:hypothetical protein